MTTQSSTPGTTTTTPPATRIGAGAAAAGGVLWIAAEVVERAGGGLSEPSMALVILGSLCLTVGVPFLQVVQGGRRPLTGVVGAALIVASTALEALVDTIGWGADSIAEIQERTGPLIPVLGILGLLGSIVFGIAVLRTRVFPAWTGILLVVAPLPLPLFVTVGLPDVIISVSKSLIGLAVTGAALAALRGAAAPRTAPPRR